MNHPTNLQDKLAKIEELWSPRVVGEVDDCYVKLAKLKGSLAWHKHDDEDELFLVINGHMRIELEDGVIELGPGEMYIVPKGVMHNPVAENECSVLVFEKKETQHIGGLEIEKTRTIEEQLRPL